MSILPIHADKRGTTLINHWQCGVPVTRGSFVTPMFVALATLAALGLTLSGLRMFSPLSHFSAMNDAYAWGIWKTFNVMTLTALGSAPLAVGLAAWVFNRKILHVVMRTALVSGFLFYATGLIALGFDVGRPWNFYNFVLPWRWNSESAMLEISICMPLYCAVFLSFELLPLFLERIYYTGSDKSRTVLRYVGPIIRKLYPFMLIGAYVIPLMHQSSLGGLLLLAGPKINPLWQSAVMPLLYLIAAALCGLSFLIVLLLTICLRYVRALDQAILNELASLLSWVCLFFLGVQFTDLVWRHQLGAVFALDKMSLLLLGETALILVPAIAFRFQRWRKTARALLQLAVMACAGGLSYRFIPASIAYVPQNSTGYFPSVPEVIMAAGYISLGVVAFMLAVNYFAVLPGEAASWDHTFRPFGRTSHRAAASSLTHPAALKKGV